MSAAMAATFCVTVALIGAAVVVWWVFFLAGFTLSDLKEIHPRPFRSVLLLITPIVAALWALAFFGFSGWL